MHRAHSPELTIPRQPLCDRFHEAEQVVSPPALDSLDFSRFFATFDLNSDVALYLSALDLDRFLTNLEIATTGLVQLKSMRNSRSDAARLSAQILRAREELDDEILALEAIFSRMRKAGLDVSTLWVMFCRAKEYIFKAIEMADVQGYDGAFDDLSANVVEKLKRTSEVYHDTVRATLTPGTPLPERSSYLDARAARGMEPLPTFRMIPPTPYTPPPPSIQPTAGWILQSGLPNPTTYKHTIPRTNYF